MLNNPYEAIQNFHKQLLNEHNYLNPKDLYLSNLISCYLTRLEDCYSQFYEIGFDNDESITLQMVYLSIAKECIFSLDEYFVSKGLNTSQIISMNNLFDDVRRFFTDVKTNHECFEVIRCLTFAHPLSVDDRKNKGISNRKKSSWHDVCCPYYGPAEEINGFIYLPIAFYGVNTTTIETVYVKVADLQNYVIELTQVIEVQMKKIWELCINGNI